MIKLSKNLKKLRKERSLTQEALAEKMNVTRQAISNWENDKTQPDIDGDGNIAYSAYPYTYISLSSNALCEIVRDHDDFYRLQWVDKKHLFPRELIRPSLCQNQLSGKFPTGVRIPQALRSFVISGQESYVLVKVYNGKLRVTDLYLSSKPAAETLQERLQEAYLWDWPPEMYEN